MAGTTNTDDYSEGDQQRFVEVEECPENFIGACNDTEDSNMVPRIGMTFDSLEEAYTFYNDYGSKVGFSVRVQYSKKSTIPGIKFSSTTYVCAKEGFKKTDKREPLVTNPKDETRMGCTAKLGVSFDKKIQKYKVFKFVKLHNHPPVGKKLTHMLPSQRAITPAHGAEIELAADSGIPLRSSYELITRESGGRGSVGFLKVDQKNYLRTRRQRMMAFGEVGCILNYFRERRHENPSFYHDTQLDSEEQMTNIFWADAEMIADYHNFGDVVTFDTTYKINKDNRPFTIFVGFNNHRQTIVFGAALMFDETADSFIWLFETFLKAMSNKHSKTIFTDQDAAMAKAISCVMPNTYHRLCKWHMMQNAVKHVNTIFKGPGGVRSVFAPFWDDYEDEDEFLMAWDVLLEEYSLRDNTWLRSIFDLRRKWGRPHVRWSWSAGMKSTQLSESLNSTLKEYLKSDHNLIQFFTHFDTALDSILYNESLAQFSLSYKLPMVKMKTIRFLVQAGEVYTKAIFQEFQNEYELSLQLHVRKSNGENGNLIYIVASPIEPRPRRVMHGGDDILHCECRLFEIKGVVCRHVLKVLKDELCFLELPNQYILKRWTKKARAESVLDCSGRKIDIDPKLARNARFKELCAMFVRLSARACETEVTTDVLRQCGKDVSVTIEDMLLSHVMDEKAKSNKVGIDDHQESMPNAEIVHAKGLKKKLHTGPRGKRRIRSCLEKATWSKKRKNGSREESGASYSQRVSNEGFIAYSHALNNMSRISPLTPTTMSNGIPTMSWNTDSQISRLGFYGGSSSLQQTQDKNASDEGYAFDLNINYEADPLH